MSRKSTVLAGRWQGAATNLVLEQGSAAGSAVNAPSALSDGQRASSSVTGTVPLAPQSQFVFLRRAQDDLQKQTPQDNSADRRRRRRRRKLVHEDPRLYQNYAMEKKKKKQKLDVVVKPSSGSGNQAQERPEPVNTSEDLSNSSPVTASNSGSLNRSGLASASASVAGSASASATNSLSAVVSGGAPDDKSELDREARVHAAEKSHAPVSKADKSRTATRDLVDSTGDGDLSSDFKAAGSADEVTVAELCENRPDDDVMTAMDMELCYSSDEEEEFREAVAQFLRVKSKTEVELAAAAASEVTCKQGRSNTRALAAASKPGRGEKRVPRKEIPFSVPAHRKFVSLGLPAGEVDLDLLIMIGASSIDSDVPVLSGSRAGRQTRNGQSVRRQTQALRKQDPHHPMDLHMTAAERALLHGQGSSVSSLPDVFGGSGSAFAAMPAGNGGQSSVAAVAAGSGTGNVGLGRKRRRVGYGPGGGGAVGVEESGAEAAGVDESGFEEPRAVSGVAGVRKRGRIGNGRGNAGGASGHPPTGPLKAIDGRHKQFVKHVDKKGWVVCRKCRTAVWPPNCAKHVQHCKVGGA
jgi:hypothetical protein